jgi:hypothetical protein
MKVQDLICYLDLNPKYEWVEMEFFGRRVLDWAFLGKEGAMDFLHGIEPQRHESMSFHIVGTKDGDVLRVDVVEKKNNVTQ